MTVEESPSRRGRKRGKHNFEPGYKDMLFKEWADFNEKNHRCPKLEEIERFSKDCFNQRRKELEEEDRDHPLLVILEEPLDATQVKNLINNEKKKKHKTMPGSSQQAGGFPFTALQGLPLNDAALLMQDWLKQQGAAQGQGTGGADQHAAPAPTSQVTQSSLIAPTPKMLAARQTSSHSDQSGMSEGGVVKPIPKSPLTSKNNGGEIKCNTLANALNFSAFDIHSEDDSDTLDNRYANEKRSIFSGLNSLGAFPHGVMLETRDSLPPSKPLVDLSKVQQCTAAEALSMSLLRQSQAEARNQNAPVQLLPDPISLPSPSPAATNLKSQLTGNPLAQSIANVAMNACNQALSGIISHNLPVNLFQVQELVKTVVDDQVQKLATQQQVQLLQQHTAQSQQQKQTQGQPTVSQFWQVMQMVQGLQNRQ